MCREEVGQGVGVEQGNVAADDHDIAVEGGRQCVERDLDRAAGSGDVVLVDDHGVGAEAGDGRRDGVALVAHHGEDVLRVERVHGREHVADERASGDLVQDLGALRLHAGSLTRGENDYGELRVSHAFILPHARPVPERSLATSTAG
jgi:hypothetical protein